MDHLAKLNAEFIRNYEKKCHGEKTIRKLVRLMHLLSLMKKQLEWPSFNPRHIQLFSDKYSK